LAVVWALAIAAATGLPPRAAEQPSSLQAGALLHDIRVRGARAVVDSLWSDDGKWERVMASIASGEKEWLAVATALHPGTDTGASETLDEAVFLALKPAPGAVLQLLKGGSFDTDFVCSSSIATDYSSEQSRRLVRDRIEVLEALSQSEVKGARDQCLKGLKNALKDLATSR